MRVIIHYEPLLRRYERSKDLLGFSRAADAKQGASKTRHKSSIGPSSLVRPHLGLSGLSMSFATRSSACPERETVIKRGRRCNDWFRMMKKPSRRNIRVADA